MKLTFHHIGIACHDLDAEQRSYEAIGYAPEGNVFEDRNQGVCGRFLVGPGPRLELLQDLDGSATVAGYLARGTKMYHQGFLTPSLSSTIEQLRARRAKLVRPPTPAIAFGNREIAFLIFPTGALIELIAEASVPPTSG